MATEPDKWILVKAATLCCTQVFNTHMLAHYMPITLLVEKSVGLGAELPLLGFNCHSIC